MKSSRFGKKSFTAALRHCSNLLWSSSLQFCGGRAPSAIDRSARGAYRALLAGGKLLLA
jgi:hypothetical protein